MSGFAALGFLHVFWFGLLMRLGFKVLIGGESAQKLVKKDMKEKMTSSFSKSLACH